LKQIVYNLLSNAVKFTPSNKSIGIDATAAGDRFTIVVWDEGVGIPAKHLERIFNPFEQVQSVETAKESGTGLGLTISKKLLEIHGGTISVDSRVSEAVDLLFRCRTGLPSEHRMMKEGAFSRATVGRRET
jgi:signal transduction histidine kinase